MSEAITKNAENLGALLCFQIQTAGWLNYLVLGQARNILVITNQVPNFPRGQPILDLKYYTNESWKSIYHSSYRT